MASPVTYLQNPRFVNAIFGATELSWIWLIARVYIGWNWLEAGWHKVTNDAWMNGGTTLEGFWQRAIVVPEQGRPAISYDWYLEFMLDHGWTEWFGPLIAVGETLVGIGLLLGLFTGIAAFFGAVMNWNFMLAGTASINPVLGLIGIWVMIAWKTSGWWGLDRFLLPRLCAPWQPGTLWGRARLFSRPTSRQEVLRATEEWIRIMIGVGLGLFALIELTGAAQVGTLLAAAAVIAVMGLGWLFISSRPSSETG